MVEQKNISIDDFGRMFRSGKRQLETALGAALSEVDTAYRRADAEDVREYVLMALKLIDDPVIKRSAEENHTAWVKGWSEYIEVAGRAGITYRDLKPGYFRGSKFFRYNSDIVLPCNHDIEYGLFTAARRVIFDKYLAGFDTIYELGCGSCQNLLMLSELYPSKRLCGMDWSGPSIKVAGLLAEKQGRNIEGIEFDMLKPGKVKLEPGSAVLTVHAMEQIGANHGNLLDFLLKAKPGIVLHYEPVLEFYDKDNLYDYLALEYSEKRGYLSGYWTALSRLRDERKVEIVDAYRPCLGGVIHEASVLVWRPL